MLFLNDHIKLIMINSILIGWFFDSGCDTEPKSLDKIVILLKLIFKIIINLSILLIFSNNKGIYISGHNSFFKKYH